MRIISPSLSIKQINNYHILLQRSSFRITSFIGSLPLAISILRPGIIDLDLHFLYGKYNKLRALGQDNLFLLVVGRVLHSIEPEPFEPIVVMNARHKDHFEHVFVATIFLKLVFAGTFNCLQIFKKIGRKGEQIWQHDRGSDILVRFVEPLFVKYVRVRVLALPKHLKPRLQILGFHQDGARC